MGSPLSGSRLSPRVLAARHPLLPHWPCPWTASLASKQVTLGSTEALLCCFLPSTRLPQTLTPAHPGSCGVRTHWAFLQGLCMGTVYQAHTSLGEFGELAPAPIPAQAPSCSSHSTPQSQLSQDHWPPPFTFPLYLLPSSLTFPLHLQAHWGPVYLP